MPSDFSTPLEHRHRMLRMRREDRGSPVIGEFSNLNEPTSWEHRVARLWRDTILPRLEAKLASNVPLTDIELGLIEKGKAFLASYTFQEEQ